MTASWKNINKPSSPTTAVTAAQVANGPVIPPQQRLLTYSPDEWEGFVEEWAYYCLPAERLAISILTVFSPMNW